MCMCSYAVELYVMQTSHQWSQCFPSILCLSRSNVLKICLMAYIFENLFFLNINITMLTFSFC